MKGICRACGKLGWPVGLPYLEECLRQFPETISVGHGPAWWAEMSADVIPEEKSSTNYPDRAVVRPGRVAELLERYPNMYADLSAYSCHRALTRDLGYARQFLTRFSHKLMFGIDRFLNGYMEDPVTIALIGDLGLPAHAEHAIFRGNAQRMLGLEDQQCRQ